MNAITVNHLSKSYGEKQVLSNLTFVVPKGKISAICGPSGCGKTTLFRILSGLEQADNGQITIEENAHIAYLFQEPRLLFGATVYQNLACLYKSKTAAKEQVPIWLEKVGITEAMHLYPDQLSGGMKSRLSLARALSVAPDILLLDEPFGALDEKTKDEMIALVKLHTQGKTVLIITHQKEDLEKLGAQEIDVFKSAF